MNASPHAPVALMKLKKTRKVNGKVVQEHRGAYQ